MGLPAGRRTSLWAACPRRSKWGPAGGAAAAVAAAGIRAAAPDSRTRRSLPCPTCPPPPAGQAAARPRALAAPFP